MFRTRFIRDGNFKKLMFKQLYVFPSKVDYDWNVRLAANESW